MRRRGMAMFAAACGVCAGGGGAGVLWLAGMQPAAMAAALVLAAASVVGAGLVGGRADRRAARLLNDVGAAVGRERPAGADDPAYLRDIVAGLCLRLDRAGRFKAAFAELPWPAALVDDLGEVVAATHGYSECFPEGLAKQTLQEAAGDRTVAAPDGRAFRMRPVDLGGERQLVLFEAEGVFLKRGVLAALGEALGGGNSGFRFGDELVAAAAELGAVNAGLVALDGSMAVLDGVLKGDRASIAAARGLNSGLGPRVRVASEVISELVEAHEDEALRRAELEHKIGRIGALLSQHRAATERVGGLARGALQAAEQAQGAVGSGREGARSAAEEGVAARRVVGEAGIAARSGAEGARALDTLTAEIGNLVTAIEDVSFRTNLIALNAAVEAARAGEKGAGFAVVADEVRMLAQSARETSRQIQALMSKGRSETERGAANAELLVKLVGSLDAHLLKISNETDKIEANLDEGSDALTAVNGRVQSIADSAEAGPEAQGPAEMAPKRLIRRTV